MLNLALAASHARFHIFRLQYDLSKNIYISFTKNVQESITIVDKNNNERFKYFMLNF